MAALRHLVARLRALFRGGDVIWSWAFAGLRGLGASMSQIALLTVPVALAWLGLALVLGRTQEARVKATDSDNVDQWRS